MHGLGNLEAAVMDVLWQTSKPLKVRDVLDGLHDGRPRAYTTVLTVLDNLHRKAWVIRARDGKAYKYEAALSRTEAAVRALREVVASSSDPEAVLLHFARLATDHEAELLSEALSKRGAQP